MGDEGERIVKKVLRAALETPLMSYFRLFLFFWQASAERSRLRTAARELRLQVLSQDLAELIKARKPAATTAFILGTGASAAELGEEKLAAIESQFSVGVNHWILHTMVPDVYSYEVDPDVRLLEALDRAEVRDKSPYLLVLKPSRRDDFSNISFLPSFMRQRSYIYSRVNIWTRKESNISRDFNNITQTASRLGKCDVLVDNGASIARMIAFCAQLGFRKIVLVGVDLNNVDYFWHRNPDYLQRLGFASFRSGQRGRTHETLKTDRRPFSILNYVGALGGDAFPLTFEILVESRGSLLATVIEVWDFPTSSTALSRKKKARG